MKAEEFRIGNYLIEAKSSMIVQVTDLSENRIGVTGDFKGRWQSVPIPITEEWIVNLGLGVQYNQEWVLVDKKWGVYFVYDEDNDIWNVNLKNHYEFATIKYVHQLQNLYFALTNKELIKLHVS